MRSTKLLAVTCLLLCTACSSKKANHSSQVDGGQTSDSGKTNHVSADAGTTVADTGTGGASKDAMTANHVDSGVDAGSKPAAGKVAVFVAQGDRDNLSISCDDGMTWQPIGKFDNSVRCFDTSAHDCDHDPGAARGVAFGNGMFVATFGWAMPGILATSKNAMDWQHFPQTKTFAGLAFGAGVFIANDLTPQISSDGKTWSDGGALGLSVNNVRAIGFVGFDKGRFVISGESQSADMVYSKDAGKTWMHPGTRPSECGSSATEFAASANVIILGSTAGHVCRSDDGGATWTSIKVSSGASSPPVWTGKEFMVWARDTLYRSADGKTWSNEKTQPSVFVGAVAVGKSGTFVAVNGNWDAWYDKQEFYRSTDGVKWDILPNTAFTGSHPINHIGTGDVDASAKCK